MFRHRLFKNLILSTPISKIYSRFCATPVNFMGNLMQANKEVTAIISMGTLVGALNYFQIKDLKKDMSLTIKDLKKDINDSNNRTRLALNDMEQRLERKTNDVETRMKESIKEWEERIFRKLDEVNEKNNRKHIG